MATTTKPPAQQVADHGLAALAKTPTGISGPRRGDRGRAAPRTPDAGLRPGRLRQDAAGDGVPGPRHHASSTSRACSSRSRRRATTWSPTSRRWASTSRSSRPTAGSCIDHVNVVAGEMRRRGDWDLEGLFIRLGASHRRRRRQARGDRHHRDAVRRVQGRRHAALRVATPVRSGSRSAASPR